MAIPKQVEELASGNASAAIFDLSKQLISKDMSDAEKSKSADPGAADRQLFNLFGYKQKKMFLFDLDRTLFSCSLSFEYYFYLIKEQKLSFKTLSIFSIAYIKHSFFGLSLKELHTFIFEHIMCKKEEKIFLEHLPSFIDKAFEQHLYYPAYEMLQYARHMGYYTAILTSSPDFLALEVAKRLGVDEVFATRYGVDENKKFAKILQVIDGAEKAKFVEALCKTFALNLNQITAYSDSFLDLDFLKSAGEKVGVNPDRRLKDYCKKQNWKII